MTALAGQYDITIQQGATFQLPLVWKDGDGLPVNITGYTARMQVRRTHGSDTAALSLTSAGGDIVLGGVAGTIDITASATATAAITFRSGVYDVELEDGSGVVTRLIEGNVDVTPEVTRS